MVYEGIHWRLEIERPAADAALVKLTGWDVGEFGDAPLRELDGCFGESAKLALFIDARSVKGADPRANEKNGVCPHLAK